MKEFDNPTVPTYFFLINLPCQRTKLAKLGSPTHFFGFFLWRETHSLDSAEVIQSHRVATVHEEKKNSFPDLEIFLEI